jgi:Cu+-exporting ATPase
LFSMTRHSTHPLPVRIGEAIKRDYFPEPVRSFLETPGCGMEGSVAGHEIWMGSAAWLESRDVVCSHRREVADVDGAGNPPHHIGGYGGSVVHVAIDGKYRGHFVLASAVRPETERLAAGLSGGCEVALLSGDNEKERERFAGVFGPAAQLNFNQSPLDKLSFIKHRQEAGKTVMMVGDGLNDAGALRQADVGVAVVENVSAFSPASDVILAAGMVTRTAEVLRYAKQSLRVVRAAFWISAAYNLVGVVIAASGKLSPVVCAILMPVSSVTVVAFACGAATWLGRRTFGKTEVQS